MDNNIENKVYELVYKEIEKYNDELVLKVDLSAGKDTRLFGGGAPLDSIHLVTLVVSIEEAVENEFGRSLILADEKAMSRRVSPFASVGLLTTYISELLKEN